MSPLRQWLVWLSRSHRCQGFGIQSPSDFAFVRQVVNEHAPYYAYAELHEPDWLKRHLGKLYLRIANWRQPATIITDDFQPWFQAGCHKSQIVSEPDGQPLQLARIGIDQHARLAQLYPYCQQLSVIIVEGIYRNWQAWHAIERDSRTGTTFDLYYCGIVFFDTQRYKHNYRINF